MRFCLGASDRCRHGEAAGAKAEGMVLGRPSLKDRNACKIAAVKAALAEKKGIHRIARELQTGVGTVLRILAQ